MKTGRMVRRGSLLALLLAVPLSLAACDDEGGGEGGGDAGGTTSGTTPEVTPTQ